MRKCLIAVALVVLMLLMPASFVLAESSDDVTVTGSGYSSPPTVETHNADVDGIDATLNGEITATGVAGDDDIRGFVWDTATHANPGNVAPGASAYSDNWTESGSFGVGAFDYELTGLTALVLYYYRACAHSDDGWGYGDEVIFLAGEEGKVYLEFRPDLDETRIRGNAGIPTGVRIGEAGEGLFTGYSLPIWNEDNEELYFMHSVPDRWDGGSHIIIHIVTALANANEAGNSYQLQVDWEHVTPNVEEVPITLHTTTFTRTTESNTQFECYKDYFIVLYNADVGDDIVADDELAFRLRRIAAGGQLTDLDGELIIVHWIILYARGDFLGDPEGAIEDLIDDGILIGGVDLIYLFLSLIALGLTMAMFHTRNMLLGFPCVIFWAVLGGYAYTESTVAWGDWQYYLFFACAFGMTIFCALSMYALREKRDTIADEEMGKGEGKFIDESKGEESSGSDNLEESEVSERTKRVRGRAKKRREKASRRME